jgi:hypothetical protein
MVSGQLTLQLTVQNLVSLACQRCARADREGASIDDYLQFVHIFPAVPGRLGQKIEETFGLMR